MVKNKQKTQEDESLIEAFSPIVNELIDRNYKNSQDKIAKQMAPLIGSAIREQIKNQKDEVVDALYPVIGNMISRYVTKTFEDMLEKINAQIQNGLSFRAIKRKIDSKVQGVSESELLLQESTTSNIRALLLIHKQTGTVLTIAENPNKPIHEPEMLASMMTAIQSFVNDWIDQNDKHQELGEIEFGGSRIVIEDSGYAVLAAIVDGAVFNSTYESIRNVLESIVLENGDAIRNFNGDLSTFSNVTIYKHISALLSCERDEVESGKKHPLIYLIPVLMVVLFLWFFYSSYTQNEILKKTQDAIYKTPQLTSYRIDTKLEDSKVVITGEVPSLYQKNLAYQKVKQIDGVKSVKNNLVVVDFESDPKQIESNIFYLIKGFNLSYNTLLDYEYTYPSLKLKGVLESKKQKQKLLDELKKIKGVKDIKDNIKIQKPKAVVPKIDTVVYFQTNSSTIEPSQIEKLDKLASLLKGLDSNLSVYIKGESSPKGSKVLNEKIALKRAKSVGRYLKNTAKIPQKVVEDISDIFTKRCAVVSLKK